MSHTPHEDDAGGAARHATRPSPSDPPARPGAPSDTDVLPAIAGYAVVGKLGEGGMGAVYLAEDARLGRTVAIKTLRRDLAARPPDRDRFLREARAAAAVESDHLVPVWAVGEAADGTPFLVMPHLRGEPLDARLRREPVAPPGLVLKVAGEVAAGLAAAHAAGLVHRDVKPANVWLEGDPAAADPAAQVRRCKVLDFGLARPAEAAAQLTAPGAVLGTPAYMAPEQARGEVVDARADLFSLGVTLYRMAAGRPPFDGPTPMAVLVALATESPPPVREAAPTVPPALADLIDRLVAKDRDRRPRSAADVVAAVRRIADHLQGAPAPDLFPAPTDPSIPDVRDIRPVGLPAPPNRPARRGRAPLILAAVALLALAGTAAWLAVGRNRPVAEAAKNDDAATAGAELKPEPVAAAAVEKKQAPKARPPSPAPPPPAGDSDRRAALWVLGVEGAVLVDAVPDQIREARRLPAGPFRLTEVYLTTPVSDAALAVFADCRHVTVAYLAGTRITNAGLAHLANCTDLADLSLPGTRVDDGAVPAIARFTKLTDLSIGATDITPKGALELAKALPSCRIQYGPTFDPATADDRAAAEFVLSAGGKVGVNYAAAETGDATLLPAAPFRLTAVDLTGRPGATDAALDRFRGCKSLARLTLAGTPVTDAGLAAVRGFSKLTRLDLRGTKVTARGAAAVARALPECEVTWDGGVVRPKR